MAFQLTWKIVRFEIVNFEAFHFLMRMCYRQSQVCFWGKSAHNIVTKSVMTTVGYATNFSVDASARCSSECKQTKTKTNGTIDWFVSKLTAAERNPSELSFSCLLISFDELI